MLTLYHGSTQKILKPTLVAGKANNDYGRGFYCTKDVKLASEWACKSSTDIGYVNKYSLDTSDLKVLDLSDSKYSILHWMALLVQNRTFSVNNPITKQSMDFLKENFAIDTSEYDIIQGYRADDSYFSFAEDFLSNAITVRHLSRAMKLGKLGIQHVLISQNSFDRLHFDSAVEVDGSIYHLAHKTRDTKARSDYFTSRENFTLTSDDVFIADIIRGGGKEWL